MEAAMDTSLPHVHLDQKTLAAVEVAVEGVVEAQVEVLEGVPVEVLVEVGVLGLLIRFLTQLDTDFCSVEHMAPSTRPLDPALDPEREYYLTRKKTRSAGANARIGPGGRGDKDSGRVTMSRESNIPSFLQTSSSGTGRRAGGGRVPPTPVVPLADPAEFMAQVARRNATAPTAPEPASAAAHPPPMSTIPQSASNADPLLPAKGEETPTPVALRPAPPAIVPATKASHAVAPSKHVSVGPPHSYRPFHRDTFDDILAAPSKFMEVANTAVKASAPAQSGIVAASAPVSHGDGDHTSGSAADTDAFLSHIDAVPHAAPASKAAAKLSQVYRQPSREPVRYPVVVAGLAGAGLLRIPEPQPNSSSGTEGLPSPISERAASLVENTNDSVEDPMETSEDVTIATLAPVAAARESSRITTNDDQLLEAGQENDEITATGPKPSLSVPETDLMDTSNDILNTAALVPNQSKAPKQPTMSSATAGSVRNSKSVGSAVPTHRVKLNGIWYTMDSNQEGVDEEENASTSATIPKEPKVSQSTKKASVTSGRSRRENALAGYYNASTRPPNYGRGTQKVSDGFLEDQKESLMKYHNISEAAYLQLTRDDKIRLAGQVQRAIKDRRERELHNSPIPTPQETLAKARTSPLIDPVAHRTTETAAGHKRQRSSISDISHGVENINLSSQTVPAAKSSRTSENPFAMRNDDSIYRQTPKFSDLSRSKHADFVPSMRSGNIAEAQSSQATQAHPTPSLKRSKHADHVAPMNSSNIPEPPSTSSLSRSKYADPVPSTGSSDFHNAQPSSAPFAPPTSALHRSKYADPAPSMRSGNDQEAQPISPPTAPRTRPATSARRTKAGTNLSSTASQAGPSIRPAASNPSSSLAGSAITERNVKHLAQNYGTRPKNNVAPWLLKELAGNDKRSDPTQSQDVPMSTTPEPSVIEPVVAKPETTMSSASSKGLRASKYAS